MNPSAEEIIETTLNILAQEEFQEHIPWGAALLTNFLTWLSTNSLVKTLFEIIFYGIIAFFALFLLWFIYREFLPFMFPHLFSKKTAQKVPSTVEALSEEAPCSLQAVMSRISFGNTKEAIKILHAFSIDQLALKKVLSKQKWKTNSHYSEECSKEPSWGPIFQNLSADFDRTVYGRAELSEQCLKQHLAAIKSGEGL